MQATLPATTAKVPCTIVTGFLGAGKTTLVRRILEGGHGRRIAVIVNEFGDVGFDGSFLSGCGIAGCPEEAVVELPNGCLCCTVADDFVPALDRLLAIEPAPDHIVIETSGLALPKPLVSAFNWPQIRSRVTVDGVVAVVDGPAVVEGRFADDPVALAAQRAADETLDHDNPLEEVFEDQLLCADLIVLNKTDLMSPAEIEAVSAQISGELPRAIKIVPAANGAIDARVLIGLGAAAENDLAARPSHHDDVGEHDHDDFESAVFPVADVDSPQEIARRVAAAGAVDGVLRIKGFLALPDKPMRLVVQAVGSRVGHHFDRAWKPGEERAGRLVVIGLKGFDQAAVAGALAG